MTPEKCLVCGHYHGGQGACLVALALRGCDCEKCKKRPTLARELEIARTQ